MQSLSPFNLSGGLKRLIRGLGLAAGLLIAQSAYAIEIKYQAIGPSVPGGNLWEYRYHVFGFPGQTDWGFDIFFPASQYQNGDIQQNPTAPNTGWDVTTVQPDVLFDPQQPHDGFYEAFALVDVPSTLATFNVSFNWRGVGSPGSQYFEVFEFIDPTFTVRESGNTVPFTTGDRDSPVPEPDTIWLAIWAVPWLLWFKGKK